MLGSRACMLLCAAIVASPCLARSTTPLLVRQAPVAGSSARPLNDPATWVTTADYPLPALRQSAQGVTGFRLTIGPDGRITACAITASAGLPLLDEETCRLVHQRAQFAPALDAAGKPMVGSYANRVRWVIPLPPRPDAGELSISFLVAPDGTRSDCRVESATGGAAAVVAKADPCKAATGYASGFVDEAGKPVARRVRSTVKIEVLPVP